MTPTDTKRTCQCKLGIFGCIKCGSPLPVSDYMQLAKGVDEKRRLIAQRNALLEALKRLLTHTVGATRDFGATTAARAAIAQAEGKVN